MRVADFLPAFISLITAFGGAYLGIRLSLKKYYAEKWWDKKAELYEELLDVHSNLIKNNSTLLHYIKLGDLGKENDPNLASETQELLFRHYALTNRAQLYLPQEVYDCVRSINKTLGESIREYDLRRISDVTSEKINEIGVDNFTKYSGFGFGGSAVRYEPVNDILEELETKISKLGDLARKDLQVKRRG